MAAAENVVVKRALVVVAILSLGLWWVEIDSAFGLPAHPLFLHVPVVFVPILRSPHSPSRPASSTTTG